jgi:hypothetical protein
MMTVDEPKKEIYTEQYRAICYSQLNVYMWLQCGGKFQYYYFPVAPPTRMVIGMVYES